MKKIIIFFIITFNIQNSFCQKAVLYFNPQLSNLYFGVENQIFLKNKNYQCENYQLLICDTLIKIDSCSFKYIPKCLAWTDLLIQNTKTMQSDTYKVYIEPINDIEVVLDRKGTEFSPQFDSLIIISELLNEFLVNYKIKGFNVMLFSTDTIEIFNESGVFQQKTKNEIDKLVKNDIILIDNIILLCNDREFLLPNRIKYQIK